MGIVRNNAFNFVNNPSSTMKDEKDLAFLLDVFLLFYFIWFFFFVLNSFIKLNSFKIQMRNKKNTTSVQNYGIHLKETLELRLVRKLLKFKVI